MYNAVIDKKSADRGITTALWKDIEARNNSDPRYGMFWMDDFLTGRLVDDSTGTGTFISGNGVYVHTVATASDGLASITNASGGIGVVKLDAETNVAGEGLTFQGGPAVVPVAGRTIVMETRLKLGIAGTLTQFLAGLCNAATAPVTGGATVVVNTTNVTDIVGAVNFASNAPSASLFSYHDEAGESAVQSTTALHTIVADTYFKYGIKIIGLTAAEHWINGVLVATYTAGLGSNGSIPAIALLPTFVAQSDDGATIASVSIDWLAVGQTGNLLT